MKLADKIIYYRTRLSMSQEELAYKLGVSRQSVSKWEMDQADPRIDKIVQMCALFGVTADELIREEVTVALEKVDPPTRKVGKYFGTDGFRGEFNVALRADQAFRIGRFLGWYYSSPLSGCRDRNYRPKICIGKDTRRSSYTLEYAIASGITSSGADAYILHVTTTPSVSYVTRQDNFDCGVMISASHNAYYDNGIKIVNRYGEKMEDSVLSLIESYIDGDLEPFGIAGDDLPLPPRERVGVIIDYIAGRNRYVGFLISVVTHSYRQMKIAIDCANGASWRIAPAVFETLGAQLYVINGQPDGQNINQNAGSTHIEGLCKYVKENHLDVGFAFDGDADRCIAVDENGEVVDGDKLMFILARRLASRGALENNTLVTTIMSNAGLKRAASEHGINIVTTDVGDKNVYEEMTRGGYSLGGEQSGHIILHKYATTGDGILTSLMIMEEILANKPTLSKLAAPVTIYPQVLKNVRVRDKNEVLEDPDIKAEAEKITSEFGDAGRLLLRKSGTEPLIRIMAEGEDTELCRSVVDRLVSIIEAKGYGV
ncbi:MAG: phosphoglucosamine mutase [Firmicutes bacterium]|nr:phosphoglucosamine mutase [Bacillota bacterium]